MTRLVLLVAILGAFALSTTKYVCEAFPKKHWRAADRDRPDPAAASAQREVCPDGMDVAIELFADALRGVPHGGARLHAFLAEHYQVSTYLVGLLGAPLHLLGVPAPIAFACVSAGASLVLLRLLWALLGALLPGAPAVRMLALLAFLYHPSTIRCLVRPQTDALWALAALAAIAWGRRLARTPATGGTLTLLGLAQLAGLFVKMHSLVLAFVPAVVAFLHGLRGRRLAAAVVVGGLLPLVAWAAIFQGFGLWGAITRLVALKQEFFENWDAGRIFRIVLLAEGPLLAAAIVHPRWRRELPLALLLFLLGYALVMYVTITPPNMRYSFPAVAPLVLLAASALKERWNDRVAATGLALCLAWHLTLTGLYFFALLYQRFVGPQKEIAALARFVFDLA